MTKSVPLLFSFPLQAELSLPNRAETLARIESGELEFIEFDAAVFQTDVPNKNHYEFPPDSFAGFATSFEGQAFVKDHRENLDDLYGSIEAASLDGNKFVQTIRLTTRQAMTDYIEGKIRRFSIAWFWEKIICSICNNDFLSRECTHWPGRTYKVDGEERVCSLLFTNPTGRHTAAVSVPASSGTEVLAALTAVKEQITGATAVDRYASEDASTPAVLKGVHMKDEKTQTKGTGASQTPESPPAGEQPAEQLHAAIESNRQAAAELMGEQEHLAALEAQAHESEQILIAQCEHLLNSALSTSRLPEPTQARLEKQFKGRKFTASELHAAIEEARSEIAAVSARVTVSGPGRAMAMFNSDDAIRAAAFDMFGAERDQGTEGLKTPSLTGIRELYLMLTGDHEFTGNVDMDRIFSGLATTTNFPAIVRDSMNKILVKAWAQYGEAGYGWWTEIVSTEHFTTLNEIDWVITGTIGNLPTIDERGEYEPLPIGDNRETSDWTKYGGYIPLTLEAILRDNLMAFKQFPRELALAGMRNISEQVAAIFTANNGVGPNLQDSGALFNATAVATPGGHANLLTAALGTDYAAWDAAALAMYNQPMHVAATLDSESYLGTGKKQALKPKYCLVPVDLEAQADSLFIGRWASSVEAIPPLGGKSYMGKVMPLTVPDWVDAEDWAAVADPKLLPGVMLGEIFGVRPQIFIAGRENDPAMFMNDETRLKVRQFLAVGVSNYRALHKNNVP